QLAVEKTLAYSRHFGLPLTPEKLHLWLIAPCPIPFARLHSYLPKSTAKSRQLIEERLRYSQKKLSFARSIARLLSLFPTIKLICATGSLAVDNAKQYDDLDIMIVTSADTLWLTRPLAIFFLKILRLRRPTSLPEHQSPRVSDKVCDNLWLDETALALPKNKRNLYTAHEVLQARPLFDRGNTHAKFISANPWTKNYLANAYGEAVAKRSGVYDRPQRSPALPGSSRTDHIAPRLLSTLNHLAFKLQYHYMKPKITRETITLHSAYFHPHDPAPW
ncbi:MAG: hypothetical protein AAB548_02100, partial [Patescibacteria group bacterium]